jgi:hypothetical protein
MCSEMVAYDLAEAKKLHFLIKNGFDGYNN